ncbi:MAG TPA: methylated-DNA--[protein]-cysteine S-methyltransferase [Steroidobacteraceae bacterium]|jgi:methylated-DNA-[protein]-cysteine S-methyltransferase
MRRAEQSVHADRSRSEDPELKLAWIDSPVGRLLAGATERALRIVLFEGRCSPPGSYAANPILDATRRQLAEYFAGQRTVFDVPLEYPGTAFQERVWDTLRGIGYGETVSYAEQSRRIGDELAVRAVAQANGQNPIVILIPCHRVIYADGSLGGYGGGLLRKQFLLDLERGDRLL